MSGHRFDELNPCIGSRLCGGLALTIGSRLCAASTVLHRCWTKNGSTSSCFCHVRQNSSLKNTPTSSKSLPRFDRRACTKPLIAPQTVPKHRAIRNIARGDDIPCEHGTECGASHCSQHRGLFGDSVWAQTFYWSSSCCTDPFVRFYFARVALKGTTSGPNHRDIPGVCGGRRSRNHGKSPVFCTHSKADSARMAVSFYAGTCVWKRAGDGACWSLACEVVCAVHMG